MLELVQRILNIEKSEVFPIVEIMVIFFYVQSMIIQAKTQPKNICKQFKLKYKECLGK